MTRVVETFVDGDAKACVSIRGDVSIPSSITSYLMSRDFSPRCPPRVTKPRDRYTPGVPARPSPCLRAPPTPLRMSAR